MNDAALSKYYFGSANQHADLSTPIHVWEHETPSMGGNYMSNIYGGASVGGFFDDDQSFFMNNVQHTLQEQAQQQHQPQTVSTSLQDQLPTQSNPNAANTTALASIPFVQIHTTDLAPPDKNYHNVFRRREPEVIKAEPIKSEAADAPKERVNATPTPPARNGSVEAKANLELPREGSSSVQPTAALSLPLVHKCTECAFVSLRPDRLANHLNTAHVSESESAHLRSRIFCPGCENIFYSYNSLEVHLREDHLMLAEEITSLLFALHQDERTELNTTSVEKSRIFIKNVNCLRAPQLPTPTPTSTPTPPSGQLTPDNLLCLNHQVSNKGNNKNISHSHNLNHNYSNNSNNNNTNTVGNNCNSHRGYEYLDQSGLSAPLNTKQKISIKSVDVLCEPTHVQQSLPHTATNLDFTTAGSEDYFANVEGPASRRPKIYIKNVDILKEPMLLPRNLNGTNLQNIEFNFGTHAGGSLPSLDGGGGFQGNSELLTSTTNNFPVELFDNLPTENGFLFENHNLGNHGDNGKDFLDTYVNTPNTCGGSSSNGSISNISNNNNNNVNHTNINIVGNNNFNLDNARFAGELDIGFDYATETPPITLQTVMEVIPPPPPPPLTMNCVSLASTPELEQPHVLAPQPQPTQQPVTPKQEVFIKNVDILLKASQLQTTTQSTYQHAADQQPHQKGTLHLRTVDELNLMNRNEVENLIAPNLTDTTGCGAVAGVIGSDSVAVNAGVDSNQTILADLGTEFTSAWTNEDYDLGDDLDCIITDTIEPLINMTKAFTPMLSSADDHQQKQQQQQLSASTMHQAHGAVSVIGLPEIDSLTQMAEDILNEDLNALYAPGQCGNSITAAGTPPEPTSGVKRLQSGCQVGGKNSGVTALITAAATASIAGSMNVLGANDVPPLAPVTTTTVSPGSVETPTMMAKNLSNIPVPPLVPCTPTATSAQLRQLGNKRIEASKCLGEPLAKGTSTTAASEKTARIYVANNLLSDSSSAGSGSPAEPLATAGGTSVRGRPYGAKRTGVPKLRKQNGNVTDTQMGIKCSVSNCPFRFKVSETLDYHKRCHNSNGSSTNANSALAMICPECRSTEFNNWNSLHTHLWRSHQIDMELYRCPQCAFRTPIYSRLINTHSKIHSEERNYKCEQCGKAFKNTKQLKNHRRWHRNQGTHSKQTSNASGSGVDKLHRCEDCGAAFSHLKSLREHLCKERALQCEVCERQFTSKSSLRLHALTHESEKRFKCAECDYEANDHNAFRRHRMTHLAKSMYECPHCDAKFIQSIAYQRHVQQKHPKNASNTVLKCAQCAYTTINRALLLVHQAKHEPQLPPLPPTPVVSEPPHLTLSDAATAVTPDVQTKSKIKVKSNLLLTHSSINPSMDVNDDLLNSFLTVLKDDQY